MTRAAYSWTIAVDTCTPCPSQAQPCHSPTEVQVLRDITAPGFTCKGADTRCSRRAAKGHRHTRRQPSADSALQQTGTRTPMEGLPYRLWRTLICCQGMPQTEPCAEWPGGSTSLDAIVALPIRWSEEQQPTWDWVQRRLLFGEHPWAPQTGSRVPP